MVHTVERVSRICDEVYGSYSGANWRPKPFSNRSSRYLWSDAFDAINYQSLAAQSASEDKERFLMQAEAVVTSTINTLGELHISAVSYCVHGNVELCFKMTLRVHSDAVFASQATNATAARGCLVPLMITLCVVACALAKSEKSTSMMVSLYSAVSSRC
jgi:hypothetical protein